MTTHFSTRSFQASHGRAPKGWGCWGFFFGDDADPRAQRDPWFTPFSMSYAEAKKAAKAEAKARGETWVEVAP